MCLEHSVYRKGADVELELWCELSFACMLTCNQAGVPSEKSSSFLLLYKHCMASPVTSFSSSDFTDECDFEPSMFRVHFIRKIWYFKSHVYLFISGGTWHMCGSQRKTFRSCLSPSTMEDLGIECKSGLAASALTS